MKNIHEIVTESWSKILVTANIYDDSNFFELGGDSLHCMEMLYYLENTTGAAIPPVLIFENPTLKEFSSAVSSILLGDTPEMEEGEI